MVSSFKLRVFAPVIAIGMVALVLVYVAVASRSEAIRTTDEQVLRLSGLADRSGTGVVVEQDAAREEVERILSARREAVVREVYLLSASLFVVFGLAIAWLVLCGARVQRRLLVVPNRLEQAVLHKQSTVDNGRNSGDPVDALTSSLLGFSDRVRTKLRESERAGRMAFADSLTGLPNRRALLAFLDSLSEPENVPDGNTRIGLIHLDLDHFKVINDTLGHDAGDEVLMEATRRMSSAIRDTDLLARLGGDEFLIVATGVEMVSDLTCIADRLLGQFEAPVKYGHRLCDVGVSMGIVLGGQRGPVLDPKRLLINADMALFRAKSEGRGCYAVFTSAMAEEARRRKERTTALGAALDAEAFHPWFQPILDCATREVVGLEVLARWHDPERGVLMPLDFMEDAEAASMMEEIGLQVLARALEAMQSWRSSSLTVPRVHLNMSRTQLLSSSFVDRFNWALDNANVEPDRIAVEIDERTCSVRGSEVVFANVRRLHRIGMQVVLDNFGSDRAALANIGPTCARSIKCGVHTVDILLGNDSVRNQGSALAALQAAAHALDLRITAKDVESAQHSQICLNGGVTVQQGDFLAPVMNVEETTGFLSVATRDTVSAAIGTC